MSIVVEGVLEYPVAQVWQVVSNFSGLKAWHPLVSECYLIGTGIGCERVVAIGERRVHERLEEFDEANHSLTYEITKIDDPAVVGTRSSITLEALPGDHTRIRWVTLLRGSARPSDDVATAMQQRYTTRIGHLTQALESGVGK